MDGLEAEPGDAPLAFDAWSVVDGLPVDAGGADGGDLFRGDEDEGGGLALLVGG